ncbi:MAG: helicase-related protein, partial [Puniceicoccaceae bacterium]
HVTEWFGRLGRKVELVHHSKRPVPLEEIHIDGLPNRIPPSVRGFWPRAIARVLKAGMAPLLAFAPRRKAAEDLAHEIARMLPEEDPLVLTPEQEKLAGDRLKKLLRARVAYHHSGLDYGQRAGLIEPLAKAGQLRVVVATMGLAAGINFSMRSVLVTDREYRSGEKVHEVRPDELLQMFGRAGRRGMDKVGYIAVATGKPRLQEARPLHLKRTNQIDWPSLIGVMQAAIESSRDPTRAAHDLTRRLFSIQRIALGLVHFNAKGPSGRVQEHRIIAQEVVEFQAMDGSWERKKAARAVPMGRALIRHKGQWKPVLSLPASLSGLKFGTLCRIPGSEPTHYGRQVPVARFGRDEKEGELVLSRWLVRSLNSAPGSRKRRWRRMGWKLDKVESSILPLLPQIAHGGTFHSWMERNDMLYAVLNYETALTYAHSDSQGHALINPVERSVTHEADLHMPDEQDLTTSGKKLTTADIWHSLGLIDQHASPTRRGILFSFFNYGEGLAIAAALEDTAYAISDLLLDLANLRAGHRFGAHEFASNRLETACRAAYGLVTFPGYLSRGLPSTYGEGAAEVLFEPGARQSLLRSDAELSTGDIERARLEWRSLLRHISRAPALNWDRWLELKQAATEEIAKFPRDVSLEDLPPLTPRQQQRHKSFLTFDQQVGA